MKIVSTWDLRAADLPKLESPFFAASKAKSLILDHAHNGNNSDLERLLGRSHSSPGGGRASRNYRAALVEEAVRRIDDGELWLVHEVVDGEPSAPVVYWQSSGEGQGQWVLGEDVANSEIHSNVEALNRHGITPQQLASQGIGGGGHLGVSQFDAEYREKQQKEARQQRSTSQNSNTSFPAQSVAPLALSAAFNNEPETTKAPQEIHLEIGIFTDGTLNNAENSRELEERAAKECVQSFERGEISEEECSYRLSLILGGSYGNAPTNVAKLAIMYKESIETNDTSIIYRFAEYIAGVGTKTGDGDSLFGMTTGMGNTGIISQVEKAFIEVAQRIVNLHLPKVINSLTVDLIGFSRGAASARHAVHEINRGEEGLFGDALRDAGIAWPNRVNVRFLGLFDTVAGVINPMALDLSPGNAGNEPVQLFVDSAKVEHAVQLVAADEYRANFALNSLRDREGNLASNFREITIPGAHSDIGGGYPDRQSEDVLISPYFEVPSSRIRWPQKTMEWDILEAKKEEKEREGWIGFYSLPVKSHNKRLPGFEEQKFDRNAALIIVEKLSDHPAPEGRSELALRMIREVRGDYSRVGLKVMLEQAKKVGVPFRTLGAEDNATLLPEELEPIASSILEQVASGVDVLSLTKGQAELVRQRYTHHSAHYNPFDVLLGNALVSLRLGRNFSPNAPANFGDRVVHPNA